MIRINQETWTRDGGRHTRTALRNTSTNEPPRFDSLQNRVCLRDVACVDDIIRPLEDDGRYVVKSTLYLKNGHPDLVLLVEYARRDYEITGNQREKLVKAFHEGKLYS